MRTRRHLSTVHLKMSVLPLSDLIQCDGEDKIRSTTDSLGAEVSETAAGKYSTVL